MVLVTITTILTLFVLAVIVGAVIALFTIATELMWSLVIVGVLALITKYIIYKFDIQDGE